MASRAPERWVALVPLRAGSKSIPMKNLRPIAGRPLFSWVVAEAIRSAAFEEVWIATDSPEIAGEAERLFGSQINVFERSPESSTDTAPTEAVMGEFQAAVAFDVLGLIQATSPLTDAAHLAEAKQQFLAHDYESLVTVVRSKEFLWNEDGRPVNYEPAHRPRRQDHPGHLVENGAFYFTRSDVLRDRRCRLGGRIGLFEMPASCRWELDEPEDWLIVEQLLLRKRRAARTGQRIKGLVVDVDGTLTDGGMYYSARGEELKKFDTRDAVGLRLLRENGVHVAVVTAETSAVVDARMKKLGIEDYHAGVADKLAVLTDLCSRWKVGLEEVAYMGDDVGDAACLRAVGLAICPADAVPEMRSAAHLVTNCRAGAGAVREACGYLMNLSANDNLA